MELFDTHAHLNDEKLHKDLPAVLARAREAGVTAIATVGYDWRSSLMSVRLAEKHPGFLHAVCGIHPHDASTWDKQMAEKIYNLAAEPCVRAVGEIGLDYYRDLSPREAQKKAFSEQMSMARELDKPIVVHDRDAHGDILALLKRERPFARGGILHCFSGSYEMAAECVKMGFFISFAGPLTYENARALQEICRRLPLDRLLIETDCPYLAPHPHRGTLNEPARVALVAQKLAQLKGLDVEEAAAVTAANARSIFGLA